MHRPRLTLAVLAGVGLLVASTGYYALTAWSYHADPRPSRDVRAELNAPWAHVPESERAATAYLALQRAWQSLPPPPLPANRYPPLGVTPADPEFPGLTAALDALAPHLDAARSAAGLPALGADFEPPDRELLASQGYPLHDEVIAGSAIHLRIPGLGAASTAAHLLLIDAEHAARQGDAARTAADLHAALAIARQLPQVPIFIADIAAVRLVTDASRRTIRILHAHPGLLDAAALAALHADLARTADQTRTRFGAERFALTDLFDRTFTPGPGGRITAVGLRRLESIFLHPGAELGDLIASRHATLAPLRSRAVGTRAEHLDLLDRHLADAEAARAAGPAALAAFWTSESDMLWGDPALQRRLPIMVALTPMYASAIKSEHAMRLEAAAACVAIAMHHHHADHGVYPGSLDALVPKYLAALPPDPYDHAGGPIKHRGNAHAFTLYYNGANATDDHATPPTPNPNDPHAVRRFPAPTHNPHAPSGDWILYPGD